jgi:hypothetical protein
LRAVVTRAVTAQIHHAKIARRTWSQTPGRPLGR